MAIAPLVTEDVPRIRALMDKYRDVPMDLADASIVRVAEREGMIDVFTLDKDFTIYRVGRGRTITIRP